MRYLRGAIEEFNHTASAEVLANVFLTVKRYSYETVRFLNTHLDKKRILQFMFAPIRIVERRVLFVDENGEISLCDGQERASVERLLDVIKTKPEGSQYSDTLRAALLAIGRGSLKSYEAFSTFSDTASRLRTYSKGSHSWAAPRQELHIRITNDFMKDVRHLSSQILKSKKMEKGLYCVRGGVAAGKSTFVRNFLRGHSLDERSVNGVISNDTIKNRLVRETVNSSSGIDIPSYVFHDEASLIKGKILEQAKKEDLLYFFDNRMQHDEDLQDILTDANERSLDITIFDLRVDFISSAFRVLSRNGCYPSPPTPDFEALFKSYKAIETNNRKILRKAFASTKVKHYYSVRVTDENRPTVIALKEHFEILRNDLNVIHPLSKVRKASFANVRLASGKTLKHALDKHSKEKYLPKTSKKEYLKSFLNNIKNTSRTYSGTLDVSASPDKRETVRTDLTPLQTLALADRNLRKAFEFVYENRHVFIYGVSHLRRFIDEAAWQVNQGLIRDRSQLIRTGSNSNKYNYVSTKDVEHFYEVFLKDLLLRVNDIDIDPIETAAWIEWNVDFSGHMFSDGCGRVAKLISTWWLMRKKLLLPDYGKGVFGFDTIRESYRKRFAIRENVTYREPRNDSNYLTFAKYYRNLCLEPKKCEQILASGGFIYNSTGQFLILRSTKGKDAGKWVIPGGKVEKGHDPEATFRKESLEETGLHLSNVTFLGEREYTSIAGNHYKFFDYYSVAHNEQKVRLNSESSEFKWINELDVKYYKFTDSIRNFLNKYLTEDMLQYYEEVEQIDVNNVYVPEFEEHTMSDGLEQYVRNKLPVEKLKSILPLIKKVEVHGIYPDLDIISKLGLEFRILEVLHRSRPKLDNSNSLRPIFLLAERNDERILVCCTTPGRDLLLHYSSMIRFLLDKSNHLSVFAYPVAEGTIDKWTGLDRTMVYENDFVLLGYSTQLKKLFMHEKNFTLITVRQNKFYTSTRFLGETGVVINCIEANYGHWGNISDHLARRICELGAAEIVHVGKVGTFISTAEVYKRIYLPTKFFVGQKGPAIIDQILIDNSMSYVREHRSSGHVSVSTTMEETFDQRRIFDEYGVETIDIESSKIAQAIARFNQSSKETVKFGSIHFASDYLRKLGEMKKDFDIDLSTKRTPKLKGKRDRMLQEIFEIVKHHLTRITQESTSSPAFAQRKGERKHTDHLANVGPGTANI